MSVAVCFSCAQGEDARDFIGQTGGTGGAGGSSAAGGTGASAGEAGTGASAGEAGTGGETGGSGGGETGGTGGTETGGTGGSTGGTGGSTGGTGGSTGGTGGSTGGTGGSTGGTGGSTGGTGGSTCTPPVSGPCDTFPQCGCASGQSCDVATTSGATACYATQNVAVSSVCTSIGECVAGASCVAGGCKEFCEQDADCPDQYAECFQTYYEDANGNSQPLPGMKVCTDHCQPWDSVNTCGAGLSCEPWGPLGKNPGTAGCVAPVGTSQTTCSETVACAPGYACLTDNKCYEWCRIGGNDCSGIYSCYGLTDGTNEGLFVGTTETGVCDI
jgi:hypothetical protein